MNVPTNLKHKPIIAINDYQSTYENYGGSDAEALSIGLAQWNLHEISMKVFRYVGRWSPQSEELPPHRVIDLCILLLAAFIDAPHDIPFTSMNEVVIDPTNLVTIENYFKSNQAMLIPKIKELSSILNSFANKNNISLNP